MIVEWTSHCWSTLVRLFYGDRRGDLHEPYRRLSELERFPSLSLSLSLGENQFSR